MRKIVIEEKTGDILSVGAREYKIGKGLILLNLTENLEYDSSIQKAKQIYNGNKIKAKI